MRLLWNPWLLILTLVGLTLDYPIGFGGEPDSGVLQPGGLG